MQKKKPSRAAAKSAGAKRAPARKSAPAAKRTRRSADDLLDRIVRAAAGEFKRHGFAGTTTATIARKADVTEAQLFRYFGSKSNLFRETVFKPLDQHFLDFINQHVEDSGDPSNRREQSRLYSTELQHFIGEHSELLTSLVVAETYDSGTAHGVGKINSLDTYFSRSTARMRARLKDTPKVDPALLVRMAFVSILASVMFRDWIFPAGLATDEEIEAATSAFVIEGVEANTIGKPRAKAGRKPLKGGA